MARYADLKKNDTTNGNGICVSLWMQGCPHRCKGCHNPDTWDENGGQEATEDLKKEIISALNSHGVLRNFSILGGEPLTENNISFVYEIIEQVRKEYPEILIHLWTGYTLQELLDRNDSITRSILSNIDYLIDGRFILEQRDITLKFRGSPNQNIYTKQELLSKLK